MTITRAPAFNGELIELERAVRLLDRGGGLHEVAADATQLEALRLVAGGGSWSEVASLFPSESLATQFRKWLQANQLLVDEASPLAKLRIRIHGSNALSARLTAGLLDLGASRVSLVATGLPELERAEQLRKQLSAEPRDWIRVSVESDWLLGATDCDLVIVAGPGIEADRAVLADAHRHGVPTLIVGAHNGAGQVGPLWLPGKTSCWRCRDFWQMAAEPLWPGLVRELSQRRARPTAALSQWVSSTALLQLAAYGSSNTCDVLATTLSWRVTAPGIHVQHWRRHPECGCLRQA